MRSGTGTFDQAGQAFAVAREPRAAEVLAGLGARPVVIVGMMGAGKTVMGRRLATNLGLGFVDSDAEIEAAAGMTISDIFARHGESFFRDRENRVVERLIRTGPRVIATGGGAFMHPATRRAIRADALSVWIRADFDVLMRRVRKRPTRPLLQTPDPEGTLRRLIAERYPVYAEAYVTVVSRDGPQDLFLADMLAAIGVFLAEARGPCLPTG